MKPATPTRHGQWRQLENGELVDESQPVIASTDERMGGPDIPVPAIDAPNPKPVKGNTKHKE